METPNRALKQEQFNKHQQYDPKFFRCQSEFAAMAARTRAGRGESPTWHRHNEGCIKFQANPAARRTVGDDSVITAALDVTPISGSSISESWWGCHAALHCWRTSKGVRQPWRARMRSVCVVLHSVAFPPDLWLFMTDRRVQYLGIHPEPPFEKDSTNGFSRGDPGGMIGRPPVHFLWHHSCRAMGNKLCPFVHLQVGGCGCC